MYVLRSRFLRCLTLLVLLSGALLCGCHRGGDRRVLVIHSYDREYPGYKKLDRLIGERFRRERLPVRLDRFYLDCERLTVAEERDRLTRLLDSLEARGERPELILVDDDPATSALLRSHHPLLQETPVVFAGVNYPDWSTIRRYALITGFHDRLCFPENLRMIRSLTGVSSVYTILDHTQLDRHIRTDIGEQLYEPDFFNNLDWRIRDRVLQSPSERCIMLSALSMRDLSSNLGLAPGSGADFFRLIGRYSHMAYLQAKYDDVTGSMVLFTKIMQFTLINEQFDAPGSTFLGGYLTPVETQVGEQVGVAARILRGVPVSQIPVAESAKGYYLDWRVMSRVGMSPGQVPAGYTILNMPFGVRYPVLWRVLLVSVCLIVGILLVWLTYLYRREALRRRRVLYDLEREKEALALAIEGGDTFAWQLKGEYVHFETAFWNSFHLKPRPLNLSEFIDFVHPDSHAEIEPLVSGERHIGKRSLELQCDFDGTGYRWWELRCSTIESLTGELRTSGLLLDIEEFKLREVELIHAREMAEQAELKESFLANMSHEIRTPLNAIVGFSNLLVSDEDFSDEDRRSFIRTINHSSEQLLKLVGDILDIARIESGYMSFELGSYRVSSIVRDVRETFRIFIPDAVEFLVEEGDDCLIRVDRVRVEQVLTNLLGNAVKFTQQGSIRLGWCLSRDGGEVELYVEDTGRGIPPAEQKMIFTRFYKKNEFMQGTGLGLSICKVIVDRLHGRLGLRSVPGAGSRFSVYFPVAGRS